MNNEITSIVGEDIYHELLKSVAQNVFTETDDISTIYIHVVPKEISGHAHDKYYVGKTLRETHIRFGNDGIGYKSSPHFYNAIQKYGWDNILHLIVMDYLTPDQASHFEKVIIHHLNSNVSEYGYNCTEGGDGGNTKTTKPVKQFDKMGKFIAEYKSAADGARTVGCDRTLVTFACRHNRCAAGYQWCYADDEILTPYTRSSQKTVYQFTPSLKFIESYISAAEAEKKFGIYKGGVSRSCASKSICAGYIWSYERLDQKL